MQSLPNKDGRALTRLTLITGDQLSPGLASLRAMDSDRDHVLMAELGDEVAYVPHHVKKRS